MRTAVLRDLLAHKARVALTLAAIVLGVAFAVAAWVMSDSVAATLRGADHRSDVDVSVRRSDVDEGISPSERDELARLPGVARASGVVVGHAALVRDDGKLGWSLPERAGTSWDASRRFKLVDGRGPARRGEVALGEAEAHEAGLSVGDEATVIMGDGAKERARVVGVYTYRPLGDEIGPSVAYDRATALALMGGRYSRVELTGAPGASVRELAATASAKLGKPGEVHTSTAADWRAERERAADRDAAVFRELLLFAGIALLAGTFVIANTFTMLVAQRSRQFALLRAIGATRRQVRRAVVVEAAVLGGAGATLGVAAGVGLAVLGLTALRPPGQTLSYVVSPVAVVLGYALGVLVTLAAAYGSARRAAATAPVAALRADTAPARASLWVRAVVGGVLVAGGLIAVAATRGTELNDTRRFVGMGGAIAVALGVLAWTPLLASGLLRPLSRLLSERGPAVRLAARNAVRDPRRTAGTASSLVVGIAVVCAFATTGASLTAYATSSIRDLIPAGVTVVAPSIQGTPLTSDVAGTVRATPGVSTVLATPRAAATLRAHGRNLGPASVSAVDPHAFAATLRPTVVSGAGSPRYGALMLKVDADEHGLRPGDTVTVDFDGGVRAAVPIVGVYEALEGSPSLYIDEALVPAAARGDVEAVYVTGASPRRVSAALEKAFAGRPDVLVTDRDGLARRVVERLSFALAVIYAMFGAALLVAVLGVVNTLALSVVERTREIGVLRAVGASRRLVRRAVRAESIVICGFGGVLGLLTGLGLGAEMQHIGLSTTLWEATVPWTTVAVCLVGVVAVGVLAAVWPARMAARTNILAATATE